MHGVGMAAGWNRGYGDRRASRSVPGSLRGARRANVDHGRVCAETPVGSPTAYERASARSLRRTSMAGSPQNRRTCWLLMDLVSEGIRQRSFFHESSPTQRLPHRARASRALNLAETMVHRRRLPRQSMSTRGSSVRTPLARNHHGHIWRDYKHNDANLDAIPQSAHSAGDPADIY